MYMYLFGVLAYIYVCLVAHRACRQAWDGGMAVLYVEGIVHPSPFVHMWAHKMACADHVHPGIHEQVYMYVCWVESKHTYMYMYTTLVLVPSTHVYMYNWYCCEQEWFSLYQSHKQQCRVCTYLYVPVFVFHLVSVHDKFCPTVHMYVVVDSPQYLPYIHVHVRRTDRQTDSTNWVTLLCLE